MSFLDWVRARHWTRWVAFGLGAIVVVGIGWAGWAVWKSRYETQGNLALTQARTLAAQAQAPGAAADIRERAEKALQAVIADYPRLSSVAQAAYLLGSMRFGEARYPEARASYEVALAKAGWMPQKDAPFGAIQAMQIMIGIAKARGQSVRVGTLELNARISLPAPTTAEHPGPVVYEIRDISDD